MALEIVNMDLTSKIEQFKSQFLLYSLILLTITILLNYLGNISYSFGIQQILKFNSTYNQTIPSFNQTIPSFNPSSPIFNGNEIQKMNTPMITQVNATRTACNGPDLNDTFDFTYNLKGGQTSPNGKWKTVYTGTGSTGVKDVNGSLVFYLKPNSSKSPGETHAALVKSIDKFCNFVIDFDMNVVKQLRENTPPHSWESGWLIFRYTDKFHYYWIVLKPTGIELGKKDCANCTGSAEGQQFLKTKHTPTLKINTWRHLNISAVGNHFQIYVDGVKAIDFIDKNMSPQLSTGAVAMYSEDAYVLYNKMHLKPIKMITNGVH
ncbi:MAG: DUF1080 domain-containing protein [Thermoproteota archaeon]|nr:DUF1080 domain-containing protein [Thermoproteota archaeon]